MDNFEYLMNKIMGWLMLDVVYQITADMIRQKLKTDREKVAKILGHEATPENMEDYYSLDQENQLHKKSLLRELEKEKIRRYLMGLDAL